MSSSCELFVWNICLQHKRGVEDTLVLLSWYLSHLVCTSIPPLSIKFPCHITTPVVSHADITFSVNRHLYFDINKIFSFSSYREWCAWFQSYGVRLQISQRMGIPTSGIIPKWDYCHDQIWISETEIGFVNLLKWKSKWEYTESMDKPFRLIDKTATKLKQGRIFTLLQLNLMPPSKSRFCFSRSDTFVTMLC